jgi:hypothetical protein
LISAEATSAVASAVLAPVTEHLLTLFITYLLVPPFPSRQITAAQVVGRLARDGDIVRLALDQAGIGDAGLADTDIIGVETYRRLVCKKSHFW